MNKAQVGIILTQISPLGHCLAHQRSVTAGEGQRTEVVKALRGLDSQIKPICFVSRCHKAKQHREGTTGDTAGDHPKVFSGSEGAWPHLQQWEFPGPGHSSHIPLCPPCWELLAQAHRSEMRVAKAASLARMLQDRAEPRRLFRRAFMAMILQMLRTGGNRHRRGTVTDCQQVQLDHCKTDRLKMHYLVRASASAHRSSAP